jgi:hypothetical protein
LVGGYYATAFAPRALAPLLDLPCGAPEALQARFRNAIYFHLGGLDLYPESGGA